MDKDHIKQHYIYKIKNDFFEEFPDPHLLFNKGENRPNYYVFEGDNKNILWFVPLSSQTEKWERILEDRKQKGKPMDIAHVCQVGPKKQAFVIQDMFPVTKDYLQGEYRLNRAHYRVVDMDDIQAIEDKANNIQRLLNQGIKFTPRQADVKSIEKKLGQKLEEKAPKEELQKQNDQPNQDMEKEQREQKRKAAMRRHLAMRER
ncbi:hypothetical protein SFC55_26040 [Niallia taxi]|uniref:type III toxin-antitoxin system CptIN family toxin n=1 Tax=Niallia taxi TaxID=2499688 RepID=UPI003981E2AA